MKKSEMIGKKVQSMLLNDVDIFACRFFTVNKEKKLQFFGGAFRGKTAEDFKNLPDLQKVVAYCFWIMGKEDIPTNTKYAATVFLKDLFPREILRLCHFVLIIK